jgi:hypothetical protein
MIDLFVFVSPARHGVARCAVSERRTVLCTVSDGQQIVDLGIWDRWVAADGAIMLARLALSASFLSGCSLYVLCSGGEYGMEKASGLCLLALAS